MSCKSKRLVGLCSNNVINFLALQSLVTFTLARLLFLLLSGPLTPYTYFWTYAIFVLLTQNMQQKYQHGCRPVWHMRPPSRSSSEIRGTVSCLPCMIPVFSLSFIEFCVGEAKLKYIPTCRPRYRELTAARYFLQMTSSNASLWRKNCDVKDGVSSRCSCIRKNGKVIFSLCAQLCYKKNLLKTNR